MGRCINYLEKQEQAEAGKNSNDMIKPLYIAFLIFYVLTIASCYYRTPIANKIVGISPEIVENGTMDFGERKKIEKSYKVRKQITLVFIVASVLVCLLSLVVWKFSLFQPLQIPKIISIISGIIALAFIIANGIGFIPNPPIR